MDLLRSITGRVLIEGHRAAEGIALQNSWSAIEAGYAAGADLLELDVQQTVDGELVLYNSYQLPDGRWIRELDSKELSNVALKGHKLVFLEDVFEWAKNKTIGLSLDIKNGFGFEQRIFLDTLTSVEAHKLIDRVLLVAWDHLGLLCIKEHNPMIKTRAIIRGRPVDIVQMAQNARVDAINLDADMVTSTEIDTLHAAGIAVVMAELINPDYLRPVKIGADVICCSDPGRARKVIEKVS